MTATIEQIIPIKKRNRYASDILDCCAVDPEKYINQRIKDKHVCVEPIGGSYIAENTAQLIQDCFEYRNTPARSDESQEMFNTLTEVMTAFNKSLHTYRKQPSEENLSVVVGMLSREYMFAGFTRTYVRDHLDKYPDLAQYVN